MLFNHLFGNQASKSPMIIKRKGMNEIISIKNSLKLEDITSPGLNPMKYEQIEKITNKIIHMEFFRYFFTLIAPLKRL